MIEPRRVLIDWDWGASGIWKVTTREELLAPSPPGRWTGVPQPVSADRHRAWSDVLSAELLDDLQQWNDECGRAERHGGISDALRERGRLLAIRTQNELGTEGWEVLYQLGAVIHRVHPPGSWPVRSWKQELLGHPPRRRDDNPDAAPSHHCS